jgi:hypothetical protein
MECNESLLACECNKEHDLHHCLRCIGISQDGLDNLYGSPQKLAFAKYNIIKYNYLLALSGGSDGFPRPDNGKNENLAHHVG